VGISVLRRQERVFLPFFYLNSFRPLTVAMLATSPEWQQKGPQFGQKKPPLFTRKVPPASEPEPEASESPLTRQKPHAQSPLVPRTCSEQIGPLLLSWLTCGEDNPEPNVAATERRGRVIVVRRPAVHGDG
jgi:hypothetical protein